MSYNIRYKNMYVHGCRDIATTTYKVVTCILHLDQPNNYKHSNSIVCSIYNACMAVTSWQYSPLNYLLPPVVIDDFTLKLEQRLQTFTSVNYIFVTTLALQIGRAFNGHHFITLFPQEVVLAWGVSYISWLGRSCC